MNQGASTGAALSGAALATLLLIAFMMGANHVAARMAFDHGLDVATAVAVRSGVTALVVSLLVVVQGVTVRLTARHKRVLPVIGLLIGLQSLCLYSSVARLPVALALLAFNTYPLWTALWARVAYGHRPNRACCVRCRCCCSDWRWRSTCWAPRPASALPSTGAASASASRSPSPPRPCSASRWC